MSEHDYGESGEERIDESGRNPTQQRIDEEGASDELVDQSWGDAEETAKMEEESPWAE